MSWKEVSQMTIETFKTLLPVIADTKMIHLQEWGEPFLHPHLFEMIVRTKKPKARWILFIQLDTSIWILYIRFIIQFKKYKSA